jgi:1-acyl-sn-glycerol-3-phosphate acyltransferase
VKREEFMEEKNTVTPVEANVSAEKNEKTKKVASIYFRKNKKGKPVNAVLWAIKVFIAPWVRLFYPFKYYGEKLPDGAAVLIGNHYRAIDPMYPLCGTWEPIHFMSKKSLLSKPFLRKLFRWVRVIGVNRDGTDIRAIMDSIKCLKNGEKISLYPEGTRNKSGDDFQPFKGGAALMAIKAKVPIIPLVIYKRSHMFKCTHVLVGKPIDLSEFYGVKMTDDKIAEADQKLFDTMVGLRKEHAAFLEAKKSKKAEAK